MQYIDDVSQSSEAGKNTIPAPALLPGFVVANRETADKLGGVQDPSVYACHVSYPDLAIRLLIHGTHPLFTNVVLGKIGAS